MSNDLRYPLMDHVAGRLSAASGRPLSTITQAAVDAGELAIADLQVSAETLRAQAAIAREAGYAQLGANLARAAELTGIPNAEILRMYETLRPGRASYADLLALADRLEHTYHAPETAALVREAAAAYRARGLVHR